MKKVSSNQNKKQRIIKKLSLISENEDFVGIITVTDIANILAKFSKTLTEED